MPQTVDLDALAKKFGGKAEQPSTDLDALARQFGAVDAKSDVRTETKASDQTGLWERLNESIVPQIGSGMRRVADYVDRPSLDESRLGATIRGGASGMLEGASRIVDSGTSILGLAMTAAGAPAEKYLASRIVPAAKAVQRVVGAAAGGGMAAEGANEVVKGYQKGDLGQMGRGVVQVAGGLLSAQPLTASIGETMRARAAAKAPMKVTQDIMAAIPRSKSTPYTPEDIARAKPYANEAHAQNPVTSIQTARDAFNDAIGTIEDRITGVIDAYPTARLDGREVFRHVDRVLSANERSDFAPKGLNSLSALDKLKGDVSLPDLDNIRRQLVTENRAHRAQNSVDDAAARVNDPGYAARQAALEKIREMEYGYLESRGVEGIRELRKDEGSVIKLRNAAERQIFNGEKTATPQRPAISRQVAANVARHGASVMGAAAGGATGGVTGAVIGYGAGATVGELAAAKIAGKLSKDEMIARAFSHPDPRLPNYPSAPQVTIRGELPPVPRRIGTTDDSGTIYRPPTVLDTEWKRLPPAPAYITNQANLDMGPSTVRGAWPTHDRATRGALPPAGQTSGNFEMPPSSAVREAQPSRFESQADITGAQQFPEGPDFVPPYARTRQPLTGEVVQAPTTARPIPRGDVVEGERVQRALPPRVFRMGAGELPGGDRIPAFIRENPGGGRLSLGGLGKRPPAQPPQPTVTSIEQLSRTFPVAGKTASGLTIRTGVPNESSIESSFNTYSVIPGIREIPMSAMDPSYQVKPYSLSESNRLDALENAIRGNKEIAPLIVVFDKNQYPYILEGGHRYDALRRMGVKSFPAKVVIDTESIAGASPAKRSGPPASATEKLRKKK